MQSCIQIYAYLPYMLNGIGNGKNKRLMQWSGNLCGRADPLPREPTVHQLNHAHREAKDIDLLVVSITPVV